MPRLVPITEIKQLDHDELVPSVTGKIKKVFTPRKAGNKDGKDWSFENFILSQGKEEIKVTLNNREPLPKNITGKTIILMCKDGEKGKSGIKAKDNTYEGQDGEVTERILWVTPSAIMEFGEQSDQPAAASNEDDTPPFPAKKSAPQSQPAASTPTSPRKGVFSTAKVFVGSAASHYFLCLKAANNIAAQAMEEMQLELTSDNIKDIATTLHIDSSRAGNHIDFPLKHPAPPAPKPADE